MVLESCIDELEKLGAISHEEARRALDRLNTLETNKSTIGQAARYGAIGAGAGALGKTLGNLVESGHLPTSRGALGAAAAGAVGAGAIPLINQHLDRKSEYGKLRKFMAQGPQHEGEYGKNEGASNDSPMTAGLSKG